MEVEDQYAELMEPANSFWRFVYSSRRYKSRRKREQDRQDAREMNPDYTPALRLANLDNLKMTAKKERAKLERLLKA